LLGSVIHREMIADVDQRNGTIMVFGKVWMPD
jgi:hypothetical protein